jgi:hypothetical protein
MKSTGFIWLMIGTRGGISIYDSELQRDVGKCDVLLAGIITDCLAGLTKTEINLSRNKRPFG